MSIHLGAKLHAPWLTSLASKSSPHRVFWIRPRISLNTVSGSITLVCCSMAEYRAVTNQAPPESPVIQEAWSSTPRSNKALFTPKLCSNARFPPPELATATLRLLLLSLFSLPLAANLPLTKASMAGVVLAWRP